MKYLKLLSVFAFLSIVFFGVFASAPKALAWSTVCRTADDYNKDWPDYYANYGATVYASGTCTTPPNTTSVTYNYAQDDGGVITINGQQIANNPNSCIIKSATGSLPIAHSYYVDASYVNCGLAGVGGFVEITFSGPDPSGKLVSPGACSIPNGASSCSVNLDWSVANQTSAITSITSTGMTDINVTSTKATPQYGVQAVTVPYGTLVPKIFFLYNNGTQLAQTGVIASCASSNWDGAKCIPSLLPSGTLSVATCKIGLNASTCNASVAWTTANLLVGAKTEVTRDNPANTSVSTATSGTNVLNSVLRGASTFFLYHNNSEIAPRVKIDVVCNTGLGLRWDPTLSRCVNTPCPAGTTQTGDECVPVTCPTGTHWDGTQCVVDTCPPGQHTSGGVCVDDTCPPGQHMSGGVCVNDTCPPGQHMSGGVCVNDVCPLGQVWSNTLGRCVPSSVTITVVNPPTATIYAGGSATINWASVGATACTGGNFSTDTTNRTSDVNGSVTISPLSTTVYTVDCDGVTASATVIVKKKPIFIEN